VTHQQWEYAVLWVDIVAVTETEWTYRARASVGDREIYDKRLTSRYWSVPLADLGQDGWELVGTSSENALMGSNVTGWAHNETSRPVRMNFFLKRPLVH
jgi:hypothetical protein